MHTSISNTAEYGSHARGPQVVDEHVRENMRNVLGGIQDGSFAKEWIAEMAAGEGRLVEERAKLHDSQIEEVGRRLRALQQRAVEEAHGVG
jgi:ketol-acid reductoisomerase